MSNITITTFKWVPPLVQGLVRDLRVRWALEEAGLPYEQKLIGPGEQNTPEHRAVQPFGQVPVYQEGDLTLFESGAIIMHIAQKSPVLLPADGAGRARVEPHISALTTIDLFNPNEEWAKLRRPGAEEFLRGRLKGLSTALGDRDYFETGHFTVADLLMTTVMRNLRHTAMIADYANLSALQARCEARPAFQRALAAQMTNFEKHATLYTKAA
jgi:glutathione S-transferase